MLNFYFPLFYSCYTTHAELKIWAIAFKKDNLSPFSLYGSTLAANLKDKVIKRSLV